MAIERFKLATLAGIDEGRIREAFEQELRRCEADCKDRPGLKDVRTVALVARLVPVAAEHNSELESCDVQFQVFATIPKRRSRVYNMKSTPQGLFFNELSPDDVKQRTLDEATGELKAVVNAR